MRGRKRKKFSRKQKIWISIGATILGTGLLAGIGVLVQAARDTDLGDEKAGLTAAYRGGDVDAPPIRFTNVSREIRMKHGGLTQRRRNLPEDTGSGLAWGDYDGDGDFDLFVVNLHKGPHDMSGVSDPYNHLFRNDGGRFRNVAREVGVYGKHAEYVVGMGASFADYDGDGDLDLYVTNRGPNRLYRNKGDGTFEEVAKEAGVADPLWSTGVAWGDYDRDGDLDLYVCNYVEYEDVGYSFPRSPRPSRMGAYTVPFTLNPNAFDPQPNRLYRNKGDGTFEDVAKRTFVSNPEGRSFAATFCDLDGDGWLDLYVNNDVSANRLYKNMGGEFPDQPDVFFSDIGMSTGTADPRGSMGLSVGEIGFMSGAADGLPDLFISHWVAQENAFYQSLVNERGKLEYRDKTRRFRLGEISLDTVGWGCVLADFDLDGRPDLAVANGSTLEQKDDPTRLIPEPIFLFWNAGTFFHDVAPKAGEALGRTYNARGLAAADYDGDGDVDLALNVNQGAPLLLRNDTETENGSLAIRLDAPAAKAFGARIEVQIAGAVQLHWWGCDVSYCSQHAPEWIVGLGKATQADRIHVRWSDGTETTLTNVPAGRISIRR